MRLDTRSSFPSGMEEYLEYYGWHFSKKMQEWAVSRMFKKIDGKKSYITPYSKEDVDKILQKHNITIEDNIIYDSIYVANMVKADFLGSSIEDDAHLAKFIKDYCGDSDAYEGMPFTRFYADCIGSGTPIYWEDMI